MTTAPDSPDYVLQIDMWATIESSAVTSEHARAKYNTFRVHGEFYELEVEIYIALHCIKGRIQILIDSQSLYP